MCKVNLFLDILTSYNNFSQTKRFRGKINIQKPKPPHFERAKYLALAKPYFAPKEKKSLVETCDRHVKYFNKDVENPYQKLIARDVKKYLEASRLVAIFHLNPMDGEEQFKAYVMYKKQGMHLKMYGKKIMELAVCGTRFESILSLFISQTMILFSEEPAIDKLFAISKKFPKLVLLGNAVS